MQAENSGIVRENLPFFVPLTPKSCISAVLHRLRYGNWPRSGFVVIKSHGTYLAGRRGDLLEMCLFDEPRTFRLLVNLCRRLPKGIFLDIGAHVGAYTVPIAKLGWKVLAIEPSPDTFKLLEYNVRLNRVNANVILGDTAVWDYTGTAWLHQSSDHSGADSLLTIAHSKRVKVQTKSLSTLLEEVGEADIAKMDIEGGELRALKEAKDRITKVATWIIEVRLDTIKETWKLMREKGYCCRVVESLIRARRTYNIVCDQKERG